MDFSLNLVGKMRLVCRFLVLAEGLAVLHDKSQDVSNFIVFIMIKFTNEHRF